MSVTEQPHTLILSICLEGVGLLTSPPLNNLEREIHLQCYRPANIYLFFVQTHSSRELSVINCCLFLNEFRYGTSTSVHHREIEREISSHRRVRQTMWWENNLKKQIEVY